MDLTTLQTDVTTWVTNNKWTAIALGVAAVGALVYVTTAHKKTPSRPTAALNGHTRHRRGKRPHKRIALAKLS